MVNFGKRLMAERGKAKIDPVEIYGDLDRQSDKGPLRTGQKAVLRKWFRDFKDRDSVIVKMHTGQGKTLVGLLMLQSKLITTKRPVVYVCPNKFLVEQTCDQARQFGIKVHRYDDGELPLEFHDARAIVVTHAQKMFNGRTKFGLGKKSVEIGAIVLDDAHACAETIKASCRIELSKESQGYKELIQLFRDDLKFQGMGTFDRISSGETDAVMLVPYWAWIDKQDEVFAILSSKKEDDQIKFPWPLLMDNLRNCHCVFSGNKIEIEPYLLPIEQFGSFAKSGHRIIMSATLQNDSLLIRDLNTRSDDLKDIVSAPGKWSGERMILVPSYIDSSLNRETVIVDFGRSDGAREYGVVALAPSFAHAGDWERVGARCATKDDIGECVERLKSGKFDKTLVIANRYDGIDLPDDTCRILIIDSRPYAGSLYEKYQELSRNNSQIVNIKRAQVIEQGMGRAVRGEKDFAVILVIGSESTKLLSDGNIRKHLSAQTETQIKLGIEVSGWGREDRKKGSEPMDILNDLVKQCIGRDQGWKGFHAERMEQIDTNKDYLSLFQQCEVERVAEALNATGQYVKAADAMQGYIDSGALDSEEKAWYLQEIARFRYGLEKRKANELQVTAFSKNASLLKPKEGVIYSRLEPENKKRNELIRMRAHEISEGGQLLTRVNELLDDLSFSREFNKFEEALRKIGELLGFSSSRPDHEWKEGPDNLWCIGTDKYLLFECKNGVQQERKEINKEEVGQVNTSCAWFEKNYSNAAYKGFVIIITNRCGSAAALNANVSVITEKELRSLKESVRAFFVELGTKSLNSSDEQEIEGLLKTHKLTVKDLETNYAVAPKTASRK